MNRKTRIFRFRQSQPEEELLRKANKAKTKSNIWTQEELDYALAKARQLGKYFNRKEKHYG